MQTAFTLLGYIAFICLCATICFLSLAFLASRLMAIWDRWEARHRVKVITEIGQSMVRDHHWFCESHPASTALRLYGEWLRDYQSTHVSEIRNQWRDETQAMNNKLYAEPADTEVQA